MFFQIGFAVVLNIDIVIATHNLTSSFPIPVRNRLAVVMLLNVGVKLLKGRGE